MKIHSIGTVRQFVAKIDCGNFGCGFAANARRAATCTMSKGDKNAPKGHNLHRSFFHSPILSLLGISLALLVVSCQYHAGSPLAHSYKSISISDVSNISREASLTYLVKNAVTDQLLQEPGLAVASEDESELGLEICVLNTETVSSGRARNQDKRLIDKHQSTYITVMYRMTVTLEYTLVDMRNDNKPLMKGTVQGEGFMPLMPDLASARPAAMRAAAANAAEKLVSAISTDWK